MKKSYLALLLLIAGVSGVVSAGKLETLHSFFTEHGAVVNQQLSAHESYYNVSERKQQQLLNQWDVYRSCVSGCSIYDDYAMKEFVSYVEWFVDAKEVIKKKGEKEETHSDAAEKMLVLQRHLSDFLSPGYDRKKPIQEKTSVVLQMDGVLPDVGVLDADLSFDVEAVSDRENNQAEADAAFALSLDLSDSLENKSTQLDAKATLSLLQDDGLLYVGFDNREFDTQGLPQDQQMTLLMAQGVMSAREGKYIEFDTETLSNLGMSDSLLGGTEFLDLLSQESFVDFYHKDGAVYKGVPNEAFCERVSLIAGDQALRDECVVEMDTIKTSTENKGLLILKEEGSTYSLTLDDLRYADKALMERDDQKIKSLFVPLGTEDQSSLSIIDGDLSLNYKDDYSHAFFDGIIKKKKLEVSGTIESDDGVSVAIEIDGQLGDDQQLAASFVVYEKDKIVFTMKMDIETERIELDGFESKKPSPEQIIKMAELNSVLGS